MIKKLLIAIGLFYSSTTLAAICSSSGDVRTVLVSEAEAGVWINGAVSAPCKCSVLTEQGFLMWIDMDQSRGEALLSAVMTANVSKVPTAIVTYQDGTGEGHPDNGSIAHRHWSDCRLTSIEF